MTLVSEPAAHGESAYPRSRAVDTVHRHRAARCSHDIGRYLAALDKPQAHGGLSCQFHGAAWSDPQRSEIDRLRQRDPVRLAQ